MIRYCLFLLVIISILAITSCEPLGETITSTEEWGCLINSDGSGFEWFLRGSYNATFTQDSQKIVYKTSDGIFTRDFEGNVNQISDVAVSEYELISPDLQYLIIEEENDIYRSDIDGLNKINLTNTLDYKEFDSFISSDGNWIAFASVRDTLYSLSYMNINGENKVSIITDTTSYIIKPSISITEQHICFLAYESVVGDINLNTYDINSGMFSKVADNAIIYELSGNGKILVYSSDGPSLLKYYSFEYNQNISLLDKYVPFSLNEDGSKVIASNGELLSFKIKDTEIQDKNIIAQGYDPIVSPNGEKVLFTKERKLPIED